MIVVITSNVNKGNAKELIVCMLPLYLQYSILHLK